MAIELMKKIKKKRHISLAVYSLLIIPFSIFLKIGIIFSGKISKVSGLLKIFSNDLFMCSCRDSLQKQPSRGVLRKRYSKNMQQIYRRAPMPNCDCDFKSHFDVSVLLEICCIFSEHFFLWIPLEGCFCQLRITYNLSGPDVLSFLNEI